MTIKKFAFEVQAGLRQAHGIDLKRSHVHEVLAALFGFDSYAALTTQQVLAQHDGRGPVDSLDLTRAASRAFELGYAPPSPPIIAAEAARAADAERLLVLPLDDVLAELGIDIELAQPNESEESADEATALDGSDADEDWETSLDEPGPRLDLESPVLRESLLRPAEAGSAEAALLLAEDMPSDDSFELAVQVAGARQADRLGELALSSGRLGDARKWFRVAAERGDTDAMKTLASELESDLKEAWTWVHLARLLGVDVMAYHAVGEDGLPADADEAGPIYGAGGFELDPLSSDDDEAAKRRAHELYETIAS